MKDKVVMVGLDIPPVNMTVRPTLDTPEVTSELKGIIIGVGLLIGLYLLTKKT